MTVENSQRVPSDIWDIGGGLVQMLTMPSRDTAAYIHGLSWHHYIVPDTWRADTSLCLFSYGLHKDLHGHF